MCKHIWREANDVRVCMRCGLTVRKLDGAVVSFDRKLPDYLRQKGKESK